MVKGKKMASWGIRREEGKGSREPAFCLLYPHDERIEASPNKATAPSRPSLCVLVPRQ